MTVLRQTGQPSGQRGKHLLIDSLGSFAKHSTEETEQSVKLPNGPGSGFANTFKIRVALTKSLHRIALSRSIIGNNNRPGITGGGQCQFDEGGA